MPFRLGTNRIGRLVVGATVTPPPSDGLIGWFDAADYTSGATWTDKSVNGLDLTLSGTYSLDSSTMGGPSLNISNGFGKSGTTALISGTTGTEYTHIEIVRLAGTLATADATFAISANKSGDDPNSISGYRLFGGASEIGYLLTNTGGRSARLTGISYNNTENWFVARRIAYDSPSLGTNPRISVGSETNAFQHYSSGYASVGAYTAYNLGTAGVMVVAAGVSSGNYKQNGYYAVNLFYNRFLSDAEVETVYDYYKSTYSLI